MEWQEQLRAYIKTQIDAGVPVPEIEHNLVETGWKSEQYSAILAEAVTGAVPSTPPQVPVQPAIVRSNLDAVEQSDQSVGVYNYGSRPTKPFVESSAKTPEPAAPSQSAAPVHETSTPVANSLPPTSSQPISQPPVSNPASQIPATSPQKPQTSQPKPAAGVPKIYLIAGVVLLLAIVAGAVIFTMGNNAPQNPAVQPAANTNEQTNASQNANAQAANSDSSADFRKSLDMYLANPTKITYAINTQSITKSTYARSNVSIKMNATIYSKGQDKYRMDLMISRAVDVRTYSLNGTGYMCTKMANWSCQTSPTQDADSFSIPSKGFEADLAKNPEIKSAASRTTAGVAGSCYSLEIADTLSGEYCFAPDGALLYAHRFSSIGGNITNLTMEALGAPIRAAEADFILPASPTEFPATEGANLTTGSKSTTSDAKAEMLRLMQLQAKSAWKVEYNQTFNSKVTGYLNQSHDGKNIWHSSDGTYQYYVTAGPKYYLCDDSGTTSASAQEGVWVCYNRSSKRPVDYSRDYDLKAELIKGGMLTVQKIQSVKVAGVNATCFKTKFAANGGTFCYDTKSGAVLRHEIGNGIVYEAAAYSTRVDDNEFLLPTDNIIDAGEGSIVS